VSRFAPTVRIASQTTIATVAALIGFAANSVLCRMALGSHAIDAWSFTCIRLGSGAATLLLLVRIRARRAIRQADDDDAESTRNSSATLGNFPQRSGGSWGSAFALFMYAAAFSLAYVRLGTGVGALVLFACVQVTMIGWGIKNGEQPTLIEWTGLAIALCGLVILTLPGAAATSPGAAATSPEAAATSPEAAATSPEAAATSPRATATSPEAAATSPRATATSPEAAATSPGAAATSPRAVVPDPIGLVLMMLAGIAWGAYSLRGRASRSPLAATADNFVRSVPMALAGLALAFEASHFTMRGLWLALASGSVASGLGYSLWYTALPGLRATNAAVVQLVVPVLAAALGIVLLGEHLSLRLVASGLMILGGVGIAVSLCGKKARAANEAIAAKNTDASDATIATKAR
jgi:drug/metabolite transporter (DMT)-like permease